MRKYKTLRGYRMSKELKLIPPTDPRVLSMIAPFTDEALKENDFKDRTELTDAMFMAMKRYGGLGLSANQVGLPYRMFVAGGHPQIENGLSIAMYNPEIKSASDELVTFKEGCLSFPFIFLDVKRPKEVVMTYTDTEGKEQEAHLKGMMARVCLHEYDHMQGRVFTEMVSKFKLQRAKEKGEKMMKQMRKRQNAEKS